jgi:hypothetical protein
MHEPTAPPQSRHTPHGGSEKQVVPICTLCLQSLSRVCVRQMARRDQPRQRGRHRSGTAKAWRDTITTAGEIAAARYRRGQTRSLAARTWLGYRIRCLRGVHGSRGPRRGTWHPGIDSRPFGAVFIWIRGRSCIDRSSSRGPLHARPAALRPPQSEERSDQIRGTGVTCGPRRPKGSVMGSQAHGGHPAAASRLGTVSYKFITTK